MGVTSGSKRSHRRSARCAALILLASALLAACGTGSGGPEDPGGAADSPPPPRIDSISPTGVPAGSADLKLTVIGANFDNEGDVRSAVVWSANGLDHVLDVTSVSTTQLVATVPSVLLRESGIALVVVRTSGPNGSCGEIPKSCRSAPASFAISCSLSPPGATSTLTAHMSIPRSFHTATQLADGKVLVAGGDASAELFDPDDASFVPTGQMTRARLYPAATLLADGRVLITGGYDADVIDGPGRQVEIAETYDPSTGRFTAAGSMTTSRVGHTAALLADGRVLVAGGWGLPTLSSAEVFEPAPGAFTTVGDMGSGRADATATLLEDGRVLIVGGWNGRHGTVNGEQGIEDLSPLFTELFDPASGAFTRSAETGTTRSGHTATRLRDGRVLILGGISVELSPEYAEIYDPAVNRFSALPVEECAQQGFTSTLLDDGQLLLTGGTFGGQVVNSIVQIDPVSRKSSLIGGLGIARQGHTATRLNDGSVLITGGVDADGNALASAELWSGAPPAAAP